MQFYNWCRDGPYRITFILTITKPEALSLFLCCSMKRFYRDLKSVYCWDADIKCSAIAHVVLTRIFLKSSRWKYRTGGITQSSDKLEGNYVWAGCCWGTSQGTIERGLLHLPMDWTVNMAPPRMRLWPPACSWLLQLSTWC